MSTDPEAPEVEVPGETDAPEMSEPLLVDPPAATGRSRSGDQAPCRLHPDSEASWRRCKDCPMHHRYCEGCLHQTPAGYFCPEHTSIRSGLHRRQVRRNAAVMAVLALTVGGLFVVFRQGSSSHPSSQISAVANPTPQSTNTLPPTTIKRPEPNISIFAETRGGNKDIYAQNNETHVEARLTDSPADDTDSSVVYLPHTPIVFASNRDGGDYEIYVMNYDGSGQRRLTSSPGEDRFPDWSPRQTQIAFVSRRDGNQELYVMQADGSGQRRLTDNPGGESDVAWATNVRFPIGVDDTQTDIAFASNRGGNLDIYLIKPDGSSLRRLTDSSGPDRAPRWSPDSSRIVFTSERDGNSEIYVMNVDGSNQVRLTNDPGVDNAPTWSPNGDRITFYSDRNGTTQTFTMKPDGTDLRLKP